MWETLANDALVRAGFEDAQIDRRTLEDQGIDRIPGTHEGKASKNAGAYESLLAKDFQKADQQDDSDASGEEDGSGEKTSSSSSSGGGTAALPSKVRTDDKGRIIDYPGLDKEKTRSAFNAEIKALNEKRASFGGKPLKEQIAQLDRLMEKLDKRVEKLQALETKTTLKSAIKDTIKAAVKLAVTLTASQDQRKVTQAFTRAERQARHERQITRYGRSYRQGLHAQIKDMKQNMALVEAKKEDFKRYKSFVDTIDSELKKHSPSITTPLKEPDRPKRQITEKEVNLKLHLKAEMVRAQIPKEFKPATLSAVSKVLRTKAEPIKIDKAALKAHEAKIEVKLDRPIKEAAPPAKTEFKKTVEAKPTPKAQAKYKEPMPVKIKALEKAIAERQTAKAEEPKLEERKNWFTPANEKTRGMTKAIDKAIKQQRVSQPPPERKTAQKQKTFSKAQERPQKTANYETARELVKSEAEAKRTQVPPQYQAKPYDENAEEIPKSENKVVEPPKAEAQSKFSTAASEPEAATTTPKMHNAFNVKSGVQNTNKGQRNAENAPEAEI